MDVAAAARLGDSQRAQLDVVDAAEALRRPARELLVRGGLPNRRQRQRRQDDAKPYSCAAPEELFHEDRQRQARRIGDQGPVELPVVEALAGRLLQDRPWEFLRSVVLGRCRADYLPRERMRPVAQLLVISCEIECEAHADTSEG